MKGTAGGRGFSLAEVAIALGIVSFGLLLIISLLPVGLGTARDSVEQTTAANIANQIVSDITDARLSWSNSSRLFQLDARANIPSTTLFFNGSERVNSVGNANLRATVTLSNPPARTALEPAYLRVLVTWPAGAPASNAPGRFEAVTWLAPNPNGTL